jgi:prephenate dehydratase
MNEIQIGIQGKKGSASDAACTFFIEKNGWKNAKKEYLINTENTLNALENGTVQYAVSAIESSRAGKVPEAVAAMKNHPQCMIIDILPLQLNHALLQKEDIDTTQMVHVFSHPQALAEHDSFLQSIFTDYTKNAQSDTAEAAEKLAKGEFPKNSIVIAKLECAEIYGVSVFEKDMPSNQGYITQMALFTKE